MPGIASSPQSDALEQGLLAQHQMQDPALRALFQIRKLERELMALRNALTDTPAHPAPTESINIKQMREQIADLLSRIVLFRVALADPPARQETESDSGRDDAQSVADRALRG
ncbi:hypothetical protein [Undibacterium sp. RuTC16W]|uniref:hypothetical protein n=1 Tax=Undibacterium sp. RuTC16W TaxID=3413048 RepID=UPI003BEF98E3